MAKFGIVSHKLNDRSNRGYPDIYFHGGNWIESKIWADWPRPSNSPLKMFSGNQRSFLDTHDKLGEGCFAAVLWDVTIEQRAFIFMPWHNFRRIIGWDIGAIRQFGILVHHTAPDYALQRFFLDGKFSPFLWWQQKWQEWPGKNNKKVYRPDWREPTLDEMIRNLDMERQSDAEERDFKAGGSRDEGWRGHAFGGPGPDRGSDPDAEDTGP